MGFVIRHTVLVSLVGLGVPGLAHAADCPNLPDLLTEISAHMNEVLLDEAQASARRAQEAIHCQSEPVSAMTLSALYQLTGALYTFKGDDLQAKAAFEWAFSVAPTQPLDPHLGLKSERAFRAVHDELIQRPTGSVILLGEGDSWIDGRKVPTRERLELSSGPHLLQWRGDGESLQSRDIRLNPGDSLEISLQRSNKAVAATVPSTKEEAPQSGRAAPATQSNSMSLKPMPLVGGALVAASAGLLVASKRAHSLFDDSGYWRETFPGEEVPKADLERQQSKTNLLYSSGLGAGALGVGLLGAGVLLGEDSALLSVHGTW